MSEQNNKSQVSAIEQSIYKKIVKDVKILGQKSAKVVLPLGEDDKKLAEYLRFHLASSNVESIAKQYKLRSGVGLASVQVGELKQIVAVQCEQLEKDQLVKYDLILINPIIISHSTQTAYLQGGEGCLSVEEDYDGLSQRFAWVKVKYFDYDLNDYAETKFSGFASVVVQHEIDHLSGILFYDRIVNEENEKAFISRSVKVIRYEPEVETKK